MLKHLRTKMILDFYFSYRSRHMEVMNNVLNKDVNYLSNDFDDYLFVCYRPYFLKQKSYIHSLCFPQSRPDAVSHYVDSPRFIPNMSFLLFNKSTCKFVGSLDVEKVLNVYCICNVCILPKFRGKGLSKFMLNNALHRCYINGYKNLYLLVKSSNNTAINLYTDTGFKFV